MTERVGYWIDLDHAYFTYTNEYIESVWWALAELWRRAACSTRATRSSPTAPAAAPPCRATRWRRTTRTRTTRRSGCSSRPGRGRRSDDDRRGELGDRRRDLYMVAWTTTPWTTIANVGLAVHPDLVYRVVEHPGEAGAT